MLRKQNLGRGFSLMIAALALGGAPAATLAGTAVPGAAAASQAVADPSGAVAYLLHPGDSITVTVLGHDELKSTLTILPDGSITFPIAGRLRAAGLTTDQLALSLDKGLASQCNEPQASVSVDSVSGNHASILGAVRTPGIQPVQPGERVLSLIATAGGLDGDADLMQATLITDSGSKSVPVDLQGIMNGDMVTNAVVHADDVLLVQRRDPTFNQIQVIGDVGKPSAYSIPLSGETVQRALTDAGGPNTDAELSHAQLMHSGTTRTVDLRQVLTSVDSPAAKQLLVPGDVLMIPANASHVAVIGDVRTPNTYSIPDGRPLSVAELVVMAGGPAADADTRKAAIVRRDAKGETTQIPVNVDPLATEATNAKNPDKNAGPPAALASTTYVNPGDVLIVPAKPARGGGASGTEKASGFAALAIAARSLLFF